jgi:hypothetical protein
VATKIRKLHAREIVRCAKRQGITLTPGRCGQAGLDDRKLCAVSVINNEIFANPQSYGVHGEVRQNLAEYFRVDPDCISALEAGFEGWDRLSDTEESPYYKVGQNVAKLAGLG